MTKHSVTLTDPTREARERVTSWLRDDGWLAQEQQSPDLQWLLLATRKDGAPLLVGQSSAKPDCIMLRYQFDFGDNHGRLNGLSKADKTQFVWDLLTELNHTGVDYVVDGPIPKTIMLTAIIYHDGLTKDQFVQRIIRLNCAMRAIFIVIGRTFGTLLQPTIPPPVN